MEGIVGVSCTQKVDGRCCGVMQKSKFAETEPPSTGPKQLAENDEAGVRTSTRSEPMTNDYDDDIFHCVIITSYYCVSISRT